MEAQMFSSSMTFKKQINNLVIARAPELKACSQSPSSGSATLKGPARNSSKSSGPKRSNRSSQKSGCHFWICCSLDFPNHTSSAMCFSFSLVMLGRNQRVLLSFVFSVSGCWCRCLHQQCWFHSWGLHRTGQLTGWFALWWLDSFSTTLQSCLATKMEINSSLVPFVGNILKNKFHRDNWMSPKRSSHTCFSQSKSIHFGRWQMLSDLPIHFAVHPFLVRAVDPQGAFMPWWRSSWFKIALLCVWACSFFIHFLLNSQHWKCWPTSCWIFCNEDATVAASSTMLPTLFICHLDQRKHSRTFFWQILDWKNLICFISSSTKQLDGRGP